MIWAVLHVDDGEVGLFEFPEGDEPLHYNNSIVMGPFNIAVAGAVEEEAMVEETEAAEEYADEAMVEETGWSEEDRDEAMVEEAEVTEEAAEGSDEAMVEEARTESR